MQIRNFVNHALRDLTVAIVSLESEVVTLFHVKSGDSIAVEHDPAVSTVETSHPALIEHTGQPAQAPAADTPLGRLLAAQAVEAANPLADTLTDPTVNKPADLGAGALTGGVGQAIGTGIGAAEGESIGGLIGEAH